MERQGITKAAAFTEKIFGRRELLGATVISLYLPLFNSAELQKNNFLKFFHFSVDSTTIVEFIIYTWRNICLILCSKPNFKNRLYAHRLQKELKVRAWHINNYLKQKLNYRKQRNLA